LMDEYGRQLARVGGKMKIRDILLKKDIGIFQGAYTQEVASHAVAHLVLDPVTP